MLYFLQIRCADGSWETFDTDESLSILIKEKKELIDGNAYKEEDIRIITKHTREIRPAD